MIFASTNKGKIKEIREILGPEIKSLADIEFSQNIEETGCTFEQNALIKAQALAELFPHEMIIADDSGLCVPVLGGKPGVKSARYSGASENIDKSNREKLLKELENFSDREAYFKTVICLINPNDGEIKFFTGILNGTIAEEEVGENGFGYDSIFSYEGKTLAQLSSKEKNNISHRAQALMKVKEYLSDEKN